ncbi:MAG TPA: subclass B3 metallo-beta-lactamase [Bryobacteraceae bacterium]|jgi:metallo-beta-lactamase class B|nr:subclass B3 metallo-beta-lactamase [Bryobacteraceae bacterium]
MLRALVLLAAAFPLFAANSPIFPPFRILGNLYYVGDDDLASYLIVTPQGSILINTGYEFSVPDIRSRMKTLGFRFTDIKILLVTHAHSDHAAGMATMKKLTGAKMLAMEREAPLLESGGKTDYLFGSNGWFTPVKVDRTFRDGDKIELGGTELSAHLTPGHTKGSTSYTFDITEGGRTYHVLIANLGTINPGTVLVHNPDYPDIAGDYAQTFRILRALPCDIFLTSHASQFGLFSKYRPGMSYDPDRFLDHGIYLRVIDRQENAFLEQLEEEKADDQAWRDHKQFKDIPRQ